MPPRENESYFIQEAALFDDASADVLTGSAGLDWFLLADEEDRATDLSAAEFADVLDFILSEL